MKTCPFCAEEIQDAAIVCKHCGRDLTTGTVHTTVQRRRIRWPLAFLAVVGVVFALAFIGAMNDAREISGQSERRVALAGLPEARRHDLLQRAISERDARCPEVTKSQLIGTTSLGELWNAYCYQRGGFSVLVEPTGITRVTACSDAVIKCAAGF